jgi:TetR/AcrR family transcriptional regulator
VEDDKMFSKFFNLDPEKQARIINAASREFAQKGYDKASTNEIVKEAGISKGLLFHYFNNKKDLYLFLYDHLQEQFAEMVFEKIDWEEKDIFNKYHQVALLKFELFKKYPEMVNFIKTAYLEESSEVINEIKAKYNHLVATTYQKMLTDVDHSKFREGIDVSKAMNIIFWSLEGYANQQQAKLLKVSLEEINLEEILAEMDAYLEVLKQAFYK